jgi:hypothetical protein
MVEVGNGNTKAIVTAIASKNPKIIVFIIFFINYDIPPFPPIF